jgi:hypothetical protein
MIKFDPRAQPDVWNLYYTEEQFLQHYPKHIYGKYIPQPYYEPERYPCLATEIATMNNPGGADHVMIAYIYDIVDESDGWFKSKSCSSKAV